MGSSAIPKNGHRRGFWSDAIATVPTFVQWALVIGAAALTLVEAFIDGPYGAQERDWLEVLLPYMPLLGFAIQPPVGFIFWLGSLVGLAAIGAPPSSIASMIVPSIIVIGLSAYTFGRQWAITAAILAGLLSFAVPYFFFDNGLNLGTLLASMVAIGAVAGLALNFYRYRTAAQESQIQDLNARQLRVRREERRKLGHELHDSVAHDVTVIAMQARRTRFIDDSEQVRDTVEIIGTTAQQALQNLRNMVSLLQEDAEVAGPAPSPEDPTALDARGEKISPSRVVEEAEQVQSSLRNAGFDVTLRVVGDIEKIPSSLLPALLRSVREIGTNILKHADATRQVSMDLNVTETSVVLSSSNTISAAPPISSSGVGLTAMKTRSLVFGGALEVSSQGKTWTTRLTLPFVGSVCD